MTITVAAVKATRHGAYGRRLALVTVEVPAGAHWEATAHAKAIPLLAALLPGLKIRTEVVSTT